jgi:pimeloyl-ACP methyl ester carboxylesterase
MAQAKVMKRFAVTALGLACVATLWAAFANADHAKTSPGASGVTLTPCHVAGVKEEVRCGVYDVFENRQSRTGRKLPLKIVLIPARQPHPDQGPVFYMAGGPGETATELAELIMEWGDADQHDVVLIDERGTGDGHRLDCRLPGSDANLEGYLNGPFDPAAARACRDDLQKKYDLSQYTTPNFADDIDEVRAAMGYDKININAGSFGTYAAQIYMRRHGEHVRSAYLTSLVTLSNRVPLYHASAAQAGLDQLFKDCKADTACQAAYPRLREDFAAVLNKVREKPVASSVRHPVTGARTEIHLSERAFADAVRVMMYHSAGEVPFLVEQALAGDFSPFAEAALRTNRDIYSGGRLGLHYCITCNEFVSRIRPEEIEPATAGSFLGSWRVKDQMAACKEWPKTKLPADYFKPFQLETPAVLVSGATDPASRPDWGEEVKSYMPDAIQLIVPGGAHTPENECTRSIRHELFRTGTTKGLDVGCVAKVQPLPFKLPARSASRPGITQKTVLSTDESLATSKSDLGPNDELSNTQRPSDLERH